LDGWVRPQEWRDPVTVHVEVAEGNEVSVVRVARSRREGRTTHLEMHHLVATLDGVDHLVDHHTLTLFGPEEYEGALARAGLEFEVLPSPMPGRDRYLATKR
jgi:hypothetical protein